MRRPLLVLAFVGLVGFASAADLKISYTKNSLGSLWEYHMTLGVDTSVSGFTPGMKWSWLILGDVPGPGTSPINDFVVTAGFPVGPWTGLTSSSGGHNGPTFAPVADSNGFVYWAPSSASDTLTWTGTSAFNAPDNTLLFSTLVVDGGATASNFKIMTTVPEPASMAALGLGIAALLRRRRNRL